ncbi:unnamed protein product [Ambrosiozyma monospora]|uniref:Unnamed protein product n=1 Tax=Ambrosiozyma monospora TaxID=43982 RepID=A0A9W6T7W5_AMBMO|nr:unnamed protein product [Ambrosiozyma monospora]
MLANLTVCPSPPLLQAHSSSRSMLANLTVCPSSPLLQAHFTSRLPVTTAASSSLYFKIVRHHRCFKLILVQDPSHAGQFDCLSVTTAASSSF